MRTRRLGKRHIFLFGLTLILLGGLMGQSALAGTIGYVDFEFLFNNHPEYEMKNEELQQAAERLTAEFQAEAGSAGEDVNLDQLAAKYEAELEQVAEELRVFIVGAVQAIIEQIAAEHGIDVVVPEGIVIAGGINLTPLVLEAMYQSYGISVPSHLRVEY